MKDIEYAVREHQRSWQPTDRFLEVGQRHQFALQPRDVLQNVISPSKRPPTHLISIGFCEMSLFLENLAEHRSVFENLHSLDRTIDAAGTALAGAIANKGKVMFCGNGGSAADAQHLAAELTGRFINDRRALAGLALTVDSSALTCIANDYSFADIFARQVEGLGLPQDCLVGISTSGNSENIVRAFAAARTIGMTTVGLLGRGGGSLLALSDIAIVVPSDTTARIQEAHILIGHTLCGMIEQKLDLAN
ncbi:MAG: SIS domain-containing protein [Sphingomonas sp.]